MSFYLLFQNIKYYLVFGVDFYIRCQMHLKSEQICIYRPGYDLDLAKKMYPENLIFIESIFESEMI